MKQVKKGSQKIDFRERFSKLIDKYYNKIWLPTYNHGNIYNELTHERTKNQFPKIKKENNLNSKGSKYKVYRVNLFLNDAQKKNLLFTMRKTTDMYNETVTFLNNLREKNKEEYESYLDFFKLRKKLYEVKHNISQGKVNINILDAAIKHAITGFKSAESNNHPNFKGLNLQKQNRNNRVIEIDKAKFDKIGVIKSIFGNEINCKLEGKLAWHINYVNSSCFIRYCKQKKRFTLIVNQNMNQKERQDVIPEKTKKSLDNFSFRKKTNKQQSILEEKFDCDDYKFWLKDESKFTPKYEFSSLDPGLTTFMTRLTEKDYKFYGRGVYDRVKKLIEKRNKGIKKKFRQRIENKIKNIVNELQWKTIHELTKDSKEIIIGNMSSKQLVKSNKYKRVAKDAILRMNYFKFRQRLKYKCRLRDRVYICVNESYTSKMCSVCGGYKEDLTLQDRVYNCENCEVSIQRDLNSCRGIWIKSMDNINFKKC